MGKAKGARAGSTSVNGQKKVGRRMTAKAKKNGDLDNTCKQMNSRAEIKWPARYESEIDMVKKKKSKETNMAVCSEHEAEVTVSFIEGGLNMNMAVTDEEIRDFDARENAVDHDVFGYHC